METFSALLAICAGNSPVPGEFPTQRPVTRSFDVYFDLRPNKRLSKQSWGWWFEKLSCSLWRHRNEVHMIQENTLRSEQHDHKIHDKSIFLNEHCFIGSIQISLRFVLRDRLTRRQHWFRYWTGTEKATRNYLNQFLPSIMMPHGVTRPELVNSPPTHPQPRQNGRHFAYSVFRSIFTNEKFCILMKCIQSLFL